MTFPVEKALTQRISTLEMERPGKRRVVVSQLLEYPVRGLVFELGNSMQELSDAVASSCIYLQENNIPFNVLISNCGKRIFLFPQVGVISLLLFLFEKNNYLAPLIMPNVPLTFEHKN